MFTFGSIAALANFSRDMASAKDRLPDVVRKAAISEIDSGSPGALRVKQAMEWGNLSFSANEPRANGAYPSAASREWNQWAAVEPAEQPAASSQLYGDKNLGRAEPFYGSRQGPSAVFGASIGRYLSAMR